MGTIEEENHEPTTTTVEAIRNIDQSLARAVALLECIDRKISACTSSQETASPEAEALLKKNGETWTLRYRDEAAHLPALKGLQYLSLLLEVPHREIHCLDLVARVEGESPGDRNAERARQSVLARLRTAMRKIAVHHPTLERHLRTSQRTGTLCVYRPEVSVRWETAC